MKETIHTALVILLIVALFFLFQGEPDVWDLLHERTMNALRS